MKNVKEPTDINDVSTKAYVDSNMSETLKKCLRGMDEKIEELEETLRSYIDEQNSRLLDIIENYKAESRTEARIKFPII